MSELLESTVLKRAEHVVFSMLDDDVFMMDTKSGTFFNLDTMGTWVWEKLELPITFKGLIDIAISELEVTKEECFEEIQDFLTDMNEKELILFENNLI
jgi:hypothetical protein